MLDVLNVMMRWLHLASVVTLIGGIVYARLVLTPGADMLSAEDRDVLVQEAAAAFRPLVYMASACLLISGIYNIFSNPGHTTRYHVLLGIKLLLVLHVFSVAILIVQKKNPRRERMMTSAAISGLAIILISAYLRRIF